ncbi:hypothetical protein BDK51DRAFT_23292, partial [Blyttiomyces helicus]
VFVIVTVVSANAYRKQSQFRELNNYSESLAVVEVIRDGVLTEIPTAAATVGDVVVLHTGDIIPADGVLISGFNVTTDESSLTGETAVIYKETVRDPFLLSGTKLVNGVGRMLVIATGVRSLNGRSMKALEAEPEETPLQQKLTKLADEMAKVGVSVAGGMLIILLVCYFSVESPSDRSSSDIIHEIIQLVTSAITVIVMAVPEGLPLAVTVALVHATIHMLKDNNLVRHLSACETMGNATTICSDKTGTLTMNKMKVLKGSIAQVPFVANDLPTSFTKTFLATPSIPSHAYQDSEAHKKALLVFVALNLNLNSTANVTLSPETGGTHFIGSKTEIALLQFASDLGYPFELDRARTQVLEVEPFSSERKRMSTVADVSDAEKAWLFVKGAPEIILEGCSSFVGHDGQIHTMTNSERNSYAHLIVSYANSGLRTFCLAYKPIIRYASHPIFPPSSPDEPSPTPLLEDTHGLTLLAVFGIQDPIRPEVPDAVRSCAGAGIIVRMVTGDNVGTARSIARDCGILTEDGLVMEGPEFRRLTPAEMDEVVPRLQVLARSSPLDKQVLVKALKRLGETVAVTGDGTNDAPALKSADVGFSMGIAGTAVAKEASDIVILDDNFVSIVKAVIWGRSVYDSARKFLQFQLTINVSAVTVTVVTSISSALRGPKIPASCLTAVQLLWVNLVLDTLAAIALATDPPTPELLNRPPSRRTDSIINRDMYRQILGQSIYQIALCMTLYFCGDGWFGTEDDPKLEAGVNRRTSTKLRALHHQPILSEDPTVAGDGTGGTDIIASYHTDDDPRASAGANSVGDFGADGVLDAKDSEECQTVGVFEERSGGGLVGGGGGEDWVGGVADDRLIG